MKNEVEAIVLFRQVEDKVVIARVYFDKDRANDDLELLNKDPGAFGWRLETASVYGGNYDKG